MKGALLEENEVQRQKIKDVLSAFVDLGFLGGGRVPTIEGVSGDWCLRIECDSFVLSYSQLSALSERLGTRLIDIMVWPDIGERTIFVRWPEYVAKERINECQ